MTFVVTVAHFCEIHGPSMVMCTQSVPASANLPSFHGTSIPESQLCQSCMMKMPLLKNKASNGVEDIPTTIITESQYSTNTFISTQFPAHRDRYSCLRKIIMRVFTVETTIDITKPLMFGDSRQGYTLALCFKLPDKTARGSERKYAILVTSDKERDLLHNYTFILANLMKIVESINKISRKVVDATSSNSNREECNNNDIYLRRSSGVPKAKSMVEILDDKDFFMKIHLWAAFLLDKINEEDLALM